MRPTSFHIEEDGDAPVDFQQLRPLGITILTASKPGEGQ